MSLFKSKWRIVETQQRADIPGGYLSYYYIEFRVLFWWERWATRYDNKQLAIDTLNNHILAHDCKVVYTCES